MAEGGNNTNASGNQNVNNIILSDGGVRWLVVFLIAMIVVLVSSAAVSLTAKQDVKYLKEDVTRLHNQSDRQMIWAQELSGELDRLNIAHKPYPGGK